MASVKILDIYTDNTGNRMHLCADAQGRMAEVSDDAIEEAQRRLDEATLVSHYGVAGVLSPTRADRLWAPIGGRAVRQLAHDETRCAAGPKPHKPITDPTEEAPLSSVTDDTRDVTSTAVNPLASDATAPLVPLASSWPEAGFVLTPQGMGALVARRNPAPLSATASRILMGAVDRARRAARARVRRAA